MEGEEVKEEGRVNVCGCPSEKCYGCKDAMKRPQCCLISNPAIRLDDLKTRRFDLVASELPKQV